MRTFDRLDDADTMSRSESALTSVTGEMTMRLLPGGVAADPVTLAMEDRERSRA